MIQINEKQAQGLVHLTALHGQVAVVKQNPLVKYLTLKDVIGNTWLMNEKGELLGWNDPVKGDRWKTCISCNTMWHDTDETYSCPTCPTTP